MAASKGLIHKFQSLFDHLYHKPHLILRGLLMPFTNQVQGLCCKLQIKFFSVGFYGPMGKYVGHVPSWKKTRVHNLLYKLRKRD